MARHLMNLTLSAALIVGIGWGYYCWDPYVSKYQMDTIVQNAALTWANAGLEKGKINLRNALEKESDYVTEDMCTFYEDGELKVVKCNWYVDVEIPIIGNRRFTYNVTEEATRDGRLNP